MKLSLIFFTIPLVSSNEQVLNAFGQKSYGVDTSFPIHYGSIKSKSSNPLGDRQAIYDEFMEGCREFYGNRGGSCDVTEEDRYAISLRQPASMQVSCFHGVILTGLYVVYHCSSLSY